MPTVPELADLPSLAHALDAVVAANRDRLAYADEGGQLTYAALQAEVVRLAGSFHASGVQHGDRVVLLLPAGLAFARAFWALQRIGAVPCALNPYAPPATSVRRAKQVRPALVVFDPATVMGFEKYAGDLPSFSLEEVSASEGEAPGLTTGRDDLAWLQPTSGTSGESRLAAILQRNALEMMRSTFHRRPFNRDSVHVAWVPPWHDLGLVRFLIAPVFLGTACHIVPPAVHTIPKWLKTIERTGASVTGAPDFAYRMATRLADRNVDLSSLIWATSGGEPVRMSTVQSFEQHFGREGVIHPGYGLAEATLAVAFLSEGDERVFDDQGNAACGYPVLGAEVRIDSTHPTEAGEILVRGPSVFSGYFEAPEETAAVLRDGWLHTGDIGRFDEDGRLYVLGRNKAMLKRGGAVLAPREVEDAALRVEGVRAAVAVGMAPENEKSTEAIVVGVEVFTGGVSPEETADAVVASMRETVGYAPDRVLVLKPRSIPVTWNGKIRHAAMRAELAEGKLDDRVLFDTAAPRGV